MPSINITVGPSVSDPATIRAAIEAGARGFRVSAARNTPERLARWADLIRTAAAQVGTDAHTYLDLPGPKTHLVTRHRVRLDRPVSIAFTVDAQPDSDLYLQGTIVTSLITAGDVLIVGDGEDALLVERLVLGGCVARPLTNGSLDGRFGVVRAHDRGSSRGVGADIGPLLDVAASAGYSAVLVSFAESPTDVSRIRERTPLAVWAKIETMVGVASTEDLARAADGVLLGRGDLLLDAGWVEFHAQEASALAHLRRVGRPFIVGTQLLTSLDGNWLPHRSELAYLSRLLEEGVGGVLLSDETIIGSQPLRAIETVRTLIERYAGPQRALGCRHDSEICE